MGLHDLKIKIKAKRARKRAALILVAIIQLTLFCTHVCAVLRLKHYLFRAHYQPLGRDRIRYGLLLQRSGLQKNNR